MSFKNQRYFTTETSGDKIKDGGNVEIAASASNKVKQKPKFVSNADGNFVEKISDRTDEYGDIRIV